MSILEERDRDRDREGLTEEDMGREMTGGRKRDRKKVRKRKRITGENRQR